MIKITVKRNQFAKIAEQLPGRAAELVSGSALRVEDGAKTRSRIKTGTMMRGWRVVFDDPTHAQVGNPVPYAPYNEFGTHRMAAQPMIVPAVEAERPRFAADARKLLKP